MFLGCPCRYSTYCMVSKQYSQNRVILNTASISILLQNSWKISTKLDIRDLCWALLQKLNFDHYWSKMSFFLCEAQNESVVSKQNHIEKLCEILNIHLMKKTFISNIFQYGADSNKCKQKCGTCNMIRFAILNLYLQPTDSKPCKIHTIVDNAFQKYL